METNLKDVAHLYYGSFISIYNEVTKDWSKWRRASLRDISLFIDGGTGAKFALRPMKDLSLEEAKNIGFLSFYVNRYTEEDILTIQDVEVNYGGKQSRRPRTIIFLLKQGFDLFGLIESGQAIDATTLPENPYIKQAQQ